MANPHTPSMNVMQVAGQRVGHEMIAERTICVGEETIVTGGWAASTDLPDEQQCHDGDDGGPMPPRLPARAVRVIAQ